MATSACGHGGQVAGLNAESCSHTLALMLVSVAEACWSASQAYLLCVFVCTYVCACVSRWHTQAYLLAHAEPHAEVHVLAHAHRLFEEGALHLVLGLRVGGCRHAYGPACVSGSKV